MKWSVVVGALAVVGTPLAVAGQGIQPRNVEVWAGYATWSGDDAASFDPGVRGGVAVLLETAPHLALGVEGLVGTFDQAGESITELGLAGLVRWSLGPRTGLHAFAQGKVGWSRLSVSSLTQDGLVVGPEIGVEIPLGGVRLVLAGGGTWNSYEDVRIAGGSFPILESGGSAYQYGARIGLAFDEVF